MDFKKVRDFFSLCPPVPDTDPREQWWAQREEEDRAQRARDKADMRERMDQDKARFWEDLQKG